MEEGAESSAVHQFCNIFEITMVMEEEHTICEKLVENDREPILDEKPFSEDAPIGSVSKKKKGKAPNRGKSAQATEKGVVAAASVLQTVVDQGIKLILGKYGRSGLPWMHN